MSYYRKGSKVEIEMFNSFDSPAKIKYVISKEAADDLKKSLSPGGKFYVEHGHLEAAKIDVYISENFLIAEKFPLKKSVA